MKRKGKSWHFFAVAVLILIFAWTAFFGVSYQYGDTATTYIKGAQDIRFGIDIRGGVDVTFMPANDLDATPEQLEAAKSVIEQRLLALNITDSEIYLDEGNDRIIVRFPWKEGDTEFDPQAAINEIGTTAHMVFRKGDTADGEIILEGSEVESASAGYQQVNSTTPEYLVQLTFSDEGKSAFAAATTELAGTGTPISIWLDDECISAANVETAITDGRAVITGNFTQDEVVTLARQINSGALPFALSAESYSTLSPVLGAGSLDAMVLAGVIAFVLIFLFMTLVYRLPGFIASIALLGQVAATLAAVSGYFGVFNSFTLTLPGIAGIILAIGMGVDANVITAERIKEELRAGKTLDGALNAGFSRGLAPIVDGNITVMIVAVILMGSFGPTDSFLAKLLSPLFFAFGPSTAGTVYSFGYTLLVGVILNFFFGILCSRVMLRGISRIKALRNPWLYGASKKNAEPRTWNFVGHRKIFFSISGALIALVLVCSVVLGVDMDIQFKGGAILTYGYEGTIDLNEVRSEAENVLGSGLSIQTGSNAATGDNTVIITMPGASNISTEQLAQLDDAFASAFADNNFEQLTVRNVDKVIGNEFLQKSLVAVAAAVVLILLYIMVRFRNIGGLPAGVMAVIALLIDLCMVYGVFVIGRIPLNANFIAAMLTILGYSINDTVVIYDRIRENRTLYGNKLGFDELVNTSISQSLRRSLNTTITTCLALGVVCVVSIVFGLDSIYTFAVPLMAGMISGVYTSLCITTSLWAFWEHRKSRNPGKAAPRAKKA